MARQFGIISQGSSGIAGCVLNSVRRTTTAQTAEARDSSGLVTDKWFYSREAKVTLSGVMDSSSLSLKAGDTITYDGTTYGIQSASMDESNTGAATFVIEGSSPDNAAIHTYSSSGTV